MNVYSITKRKKKVYYFFGRGGGLKECLEGRQIIFKNNFDLLMSKKLYTFKYFDERINADIYELSDFDLCFCLPLRLGVFYWENKPTENIDKWLENK